MVEDFHRGVSDMEEPGIMGGEDLQFTPLTRQETLGTLVPSYIPVCLPSGKEEGKT